MPRPNPLDRAVRPVRSLLIEGWRGINHSFALVNQHQIAELVGDPELRLFHRDLPFAFPHWSRAGNAASFPADRQAAIDALAEPDGGTVDAVYRIVSPFRAGAPDAAHRTVTFMVTELGLSDASFAGGCGTAEAITRGDDRIATPSRWSRDRLVDWGFAAEKIAVIPHGVDPGRFHPSPAAERARARATLGIADDETLFLNVGLPSWNKGIDVLLLAFAALRARGRKARLILKDQKDLYGLAVEDLIARVGAGCPSLLRSDTLAAISTLSVNIDSGALRALYAAADCYVSPYRAEGFNLPVLEAIACGTPVIATRGGATDDICDDAVAWRIGGRSGTREDAAQGFVGRFVEPDLPDLVEAMDRVATGTAPRPPGFEAGRQALVERLTWRAAARRLKALAFGTAEDRGEGPHESAPIAVASEPAAAPRPDRVVGGLHQILIVDGFDLPAALPPVVLQNADSLRAAHPGASYTLWSGEMLREMIRRDFDRSVLDAFDLLAPYAYKSDLARLCLLHRDGGLYADLGMRFLDPLVPPAGVGFAAFASPPNESPAWVSLSNGIIWSKPGRPELRLAIEAIVANCRRRFYGPNCLYPTGPVLFGQAVAAARTTRPDAADDQWIGQQRALTPERERKNWCYVTPDATLVATNVKRIPADLTHLGATGTNNYFALWATGRAYGKRPEDGAPALADRAGA